LESRPPVVFVSYAHDSDDHIGQVVQFATQLRSQGVDARLDVYSDAVRQDWYTWMGRQVETSDFVIVIASPAYRVAGDGDAPADHHRGVQAEAALLRDRLYQNRPLWEKRILPVVLPGGSIEDIPRTLTPYTTSRYEIPSLTPAGLAGLLRVLRGESTVPWPPLVPLPEFTAWPTIVPNEGLAKAADDLAAVSIAALRRTEDRAGDLIDLHWTAPDGSTGTVATIVTRYQATASRRLLILGGGGAGKTVAAGRLARDLLHARVGHGDIPVPILLPVGDWQPKKQDLRAWLVATLIRDYPHLRAKAGAFPTLAAALVDTARVLPVLDGFDEIAPGLRVAALREIADCSLVLVLTSRPAEYDTAAGKVERTLTNDSVSLDPLTAEAVTEHFGGDSRWKPVLAARGPLMETLRTPLMADLAAAVYGPRTDREPSELLAFRTRQAIETHLLAHYVPALYRASSERLIPGRGGRTWAGDDAHRWLVTIAVDLRRRGEQAFGWWDVPQAVPDRTRRLLLGLTPLLVMVAAVVPLLVSWSSSNPLIGALTTWVPFGVGGVAARHRTRWACYVAAPVVGLATAATIGEDGTVVLAYGAWFGLVYLAGVALFGHDLPTPSQTRLPMKKLWPWRKAPAAAKSTPPESDLWSRLRRRLLAAVVGGFAAVVFLVVRHSYRPLLHEQAWVIVAMVGLVGGFSVGLVVAAWVVGVAVAVAVVFVVATLAGADGTAEMVALWPLAVIGAGAVVVVLVLVVRAMGRGFEENVEIPEAADARSTRMKDRNNTLIQGVASTTGIVAVTEGVGAVLFEGTPPWAATAVGAALFATVVLGKAWGQWLLFARFWLPLRDELPWRTDAFLEDAVTRGVLRRTGAVYRFRHVRLRDALVQG
jgi:hypothetical protein